MNGAVRLRWSSHQSTIVSMVDTFLTDETMVDVTLTCEGQTLQAHKLILSACSPYLQKLLSSIVQGNPVVFLKGVKFTELKALIQFIYRGEVNISQEDLPSFLTLAEELQIRGLANQGDPNSATQQIRSKILEATIKSGSKDGVPSSSASESISRQNPSSSSSPPPLKKARTNCIPATARGAGKDIENGIGSVQNSDSVVVSGNHSSPEGLQYEQEQVEISGDEDEDAVNAQQDQIEDDKAYSIVGMTMGGGFARSDWTEVLEEDENSGQFSLSDPDSWQIMDNEELEMIPDDDDDDDILEIPGGPGGSRNSSGGADNEPSLCPLCNKQFQKRKTWNTHCLYDCPMVPPKYSCPNCDYRARRGYQLKIHCLKIHGIVT